jgi:SAM-dependent methyltransferase
MATQALIKLLDDTRTATLQAVNGVNSEIVIYPDSGWRLQDVIGHIATWENEVVNVLRYVEGKRYRFTDYEFEEDYNQKQFEKRKHLTAEQVYAEFAAVRDNLKTLLAGLTAEQFAGTVPYPWGGEGSIQHMIADIDSHEREHYREILRVLGGPGGKRPWHDDDTFWEAVMPVIFTQQRVKYGAIEVGLIIGLLDLAPGAHVLDLGCGIGRHTLEFARRGYHATGLDRTAVYLDRARETARAEKLDVEFVRADMRTFSKPETFDATISMFTSFGYFSPQENRQVLLTAHQNLKPGGALLIDLSGLEAIAGHFRSRDWDEVEGVLFLEERRVQNDWERIVNRWIVIKDNQRYETTFSMHLYSAPELRSLLKACGFSTVNIYGDLSGAPYDQHAQHLVAVARK